MLNILLLLFDQVGKTRPSKPKPSRRPWKPNAVGNRGTYVPSWLRHSQGWYQQRTNSLTRFMKDAIVQQYGSLPKPSNVAKPPVLIDLSEEKLAIPALSNDAAIQWQATQSVELYTKMMGSLKVIAEHIPLLPEQDYRHVQKHVQTIQEHWAHFMSDFTALSGVRLPPVFTPWFDTIVDAVQRDLGTLIQYAYETTLVFTDHVQGTMEALRDTLEQKNQEFKVKQQLQTETVGRAHAASMASSGLGATAELRKNASQWWNDAVETSKRALESRLTAFRSIKASEASLSVTHFVSGILIGTDATDIGAKMEDLKKRAQNNQAAFMELERRTEAILQTTSEIKDILTASQLVPALQPEAKQAPVSPNRIPRGTRKRPPRRIAIDPDENRDDETVTDEDSDQEEPLEDQKSKPVAPPAEPDKGEAEINLGELKQQEKKQDEDLQIKELKDLDVKDEMRTQRIQKALAKQNPLGFLYLCPAGANILVDFIALAAVLAQDLGNKVYFLLPWKEDQQMEHAERVGLIQAVEKMGGYAMQIEFHYDLKTVMNAIQEEVNAIQEELKKHPGIKLAEKRNLLLVPKSESKPMYRDVGPNVQLILGVNDFHMIRKGTLNQLLNHVERRDSLTGGFGQDLKENKSICFMRKDDYKAGTLIDTIEVSPEMAAGRFHDTNMDEWNQGIDGNFNYLNLFGMGWETDRFRVFSDLLSNKKTPKGKYLPVDVISCGTIVSARKNTKALNKLRQWIGREVQGQYLDMWRSMHIDTWRKYCHDLDARMYPNRDVIITDVDEEANVNEILYWYQASSALALYSSPHEKFTIERARNALTAYNVWHEDLGTLIHA